MKGIILAAGIGERMRPLTDKTPKPMLAINGSPVLEYLIALFRKHGISDIGITTCYLKEKITEYFKTGTDFGVNLTYLDEHELLSSARAIYLLKDFVDDAVVISNGDNLTDLDLSRIIQSHKDSAADITVVIYPRSKTQPPSSQVFYDSNNFMTEYHKEISEGLKMEIPENKLFANLGVYVFNKNVLESIPPLSEENIGDMFPFFMRKGFKINVYKLQTGEYFKEIGKMDRFLGAKEEIESGKVKLSLNLERRTLHPIINPSPKLELGSGQKPSVGYLHQDVTKQEGVDLDFICNPWEIPMAENTLNEVLALGCIEHLRYSEVRQTLTHINKLLKPQGVFLFDVPDMKVWGKYVYNLTHEKEYENPFREEHVWATVYGWQRWPGDEHKSGWTKETITKYLTESGFTKIEYGVKHMVNQGIYRGRFSRYGDAHIYIKATK